ncbi:MAG: SEC-C metal-binding domain-containing protein [Asticcacaulis sp.]
MLLLTGLAMEDGEVEQGMDADEVVEMKAGAPDIIVAALYELYDARLKASGSLTPRRNTRVPGRNDPCPCGSGKKFKACCGSS